MVETHLWVPGQVPPKGSAVAYTRPQGGVTVRQVNASSLAVWTATIRHAWASLTPCPDPIPRGEPVQVEMHFYRIRPKGHYRGKAQTLRSTAPSQPPNPPDLDKLVRSALDALKGLAYVDDGQVCGFGDTRKCYCTSDRPAPGVEIWVRRLL